MPGSKTAEDRHLIMTVHDWHGANALYSGKYFYHKYAKGTAICTIKDFLCNYELSRKGQIKLIYYLGNSDCTSNSAINFVDIKYLPIKIERRSDSCPPPTWDFLAYSVLGGWYHMKTFVCHFKSWIHKPKVLWFHLYSISQSSSGQKIENRNSIVYNIHLM